MRRPDRLGYDRTGAFREGGKYPARAQPADAVLVEQLFPVHVAGLHSAGRGVAAVVERDGAALRHADFGEVQADAVLLADAVVLALDDVTDVHPGGPGVVADDRAHGAAVQTTHPRRAQAEPRQRVRDVVFAAAD